MIITDENEFKSIHSEWRSLGDKHCHLLSDSEYFRLIELSHSITDYVIRSLEMQGPAKAIIAQMI
jgi:hypothetical protein